MQTMKNAYAKLINFSTFSILLPFIYGCQVGSGNSNFLSGFSGGGSSSGFTDSSPVPPADIATMHNPEPATMLLLGGGLAAMTYYRNRNKRQPTKKA